jgi:hypothetical protein
MQFVAGRRPVGAWRWDLATDRWTWDEWITRLHGYGPTDAPAPTTELVIVHTMRPDRAAVQELLDQLRRHPAPFAALVRVHATTGRVTPATIIGRPEPERPRVLSGWLVSHDEGDVPAAADPAPSVADLEQEVTHLHRALDTRDLIGRAKGILQARLGLDDQAAFDLLSRTSQNANVRLVTVAERLVAQAGTAQVPEPDQRAFGESLMRLVLAAR